MFGTIATIKGFAGLTMLVSSIGMQFATNSANNKQSKELADKQRRLQDLLDRQKIEHSQQLQIEINNLQVAMENEVHLLRMKEIENSHDELIENIVQGHDISSWPLNVLPFVIKGKSFGTKIGGGAKTISVHCFLTPSNSAAFNRVLYSELDIKLQSDINANWSTRSTHPIFYYGGAWRDKTADINHIFNCVEQLATELRSMPCVVITPYFEEDGIVFSVKMWGMGDGSQHTAKFEFKNVDELTLPGEIKFSYNYSINQKFNSSDFSSLGDGATSELDKFLDTTRDEFSVYLQALIGFITDKYFWSMYGVSPVLPNLLISGKINTNGLPWVDKGTKLFYKDLLTSYTDKNGLTKQIENRLSLYEGSRCLLDQNERNDVINNLIIEYQNKHAVKLVDNVYECLGEILIDKLDIPSFESFIIDSSDPQLKVLFEKQKNLVLSHVDNIYYCFDESELYAKLIQHTPKNITSIYKVISPNIVLSILLKGDVTICLSAYILYRPVDCVGETYLLDIERKSRAKIFEIQYFEHLPKNILPAEIQSEYKKYCHQCSEMEKFGVKVLLNMSELFVNEPLGIPSYADILSWCKNNYESGDKLYIAVFRHDGYYHVLSYLSPSDSVVLNKSRIFKGYTLSDSIKEKLGYNILFVQPII